MPNPFVFRRPRPKPRVATVIPLRRISKGCVVSPRPPAGGDAA
jgi:hypothetical protein